VPSLILLLPLQAGDLIEATPSRARQGMPPRRAKKIAERTG
jgi:hypothetical protein